MTKISVTGHRHLSHDFEDIQQALEKMFEHFKPSVVLTGMAVGFDQLVAFTCLKNNIPFEAAVPFKGQEALWPEDVKEGYQALLEQAQKVTIVSSGGYQAWKMHARNAYLVNNCDVLFAYIQPNTKEGGTFSCVKLAESTKSKQVVNVFTMADFLVKTKNDKPKS